MTMTGLEKAIVKTVCYADVFDYPLSQQELYYYLIWEQKSKSPTKKDLIPVMFELVKQKKLFQNGGFFYLPGRGEIVSLRKKRQKISSRKMKLAGKIFKNKVNDENILGLFVTGALSMENADVSDDIDVMIVTRANKLWSSRLRLNMTLKSVRRRYGATNVENKICTNMYLDETALQVPEEKRSLYTAHEVIQVKLLLNKNNVYERFLSENAWVSEYLPNVGIAKEADHLFERKGDEADLGEKLAYKLQYVYMKRKITREIITPHMAYFHPRNTNKEVLRKYEMRFSKIAKIQP